MDKDLSNIYIASRFKTKIILVADIEKVVYSPPYMGSIIYYQKS